MQLTLSTENAEDIALILALASRLNILVEKTESDTLNETDLNLEGISLKDYNNELDKADMEISRNNFITHEEAISLSKTWKNQKGLK